MSLDWIGNSVTLLLGIGAFFAGAITERKRDDRAFEREKAARYADAREKLEDERHQFQLDTLLALQDATREYMRAVVRGLWADRNAIKLTGNFGNLPEDVDRELFEKGINFSRLINRVVDDDLRNAFHQLIALGSEAALPPIDQKSRTPADLLDVVAKRESSLSVYFQEVSTLLGDVLRSELNRKPATPM